MPKVVELWSNTLSVIPTDGPLKINPRDLNKRQFCGFPDLNAIVPDSHMSDGIPDTDLAWYITASDSFCEEGTLALAMPCNFDQFDRPTAGVINFCLDSIEDIESESDIQNTFFIAAHEAGHVLGLVASALPYFYDSDTGKPRTKRPFKQTKVTCVTGREQTVVMPDPNTLQISTEEHNNQRYAMVTTPKVKTVVRNHFNCQTLQGARLENQPTNPRSCFGDHWEEQHFYPELMTSTMKLTSTILSPLSLAYLEDSGWYIANYSHSNILPWGHGVGCDFVTKPCLHISKKATIDDDGNIVKKTILPTHSKGFFCRERKLGCSAALTHKMGCVIIDYSKPEYYQNAIPSPPFHSQYFSSSPYLGGPSQSNYCPIYGSPIQGYSYDDLTCENPDNHQKFLGIYNEYNEYYGDGSKCFETNTGSGRCYETQCIRNPPSLQLNLKGKWHSCEYDFQEITIRSVSGIARLKYDIIVCPRLSSACPDLFCPVNCAGRGMCDYYNTINKTIHPICKCFNKSDTSPGCTESYTPKSYLQDDTKLINNVIDSVLDDWVDTYFEEWDGDMQNFFTSNWKPIASILVGVISIIYCIYYTFCSKGSKKRGKDRKKIKESSS